MKRVPLFLLFAVMVAALALGVMTRPAPAGSFNATDVDRWVVRAFFDDPEMVAGVASWTEPWEVDYRKGFLVVDVDAFGLERLRAAGFRVEIDTELTAELHRPRQPLPGQVSGIPGYPCYRTVEETFTTAEQIVAAHPDLATWLDVGDSWEKWNFGGNPGYDMLVLRLTNSAVPGPKPKLFVMTSVHAREYTPAELNTRFAEYMVDNYGTDADVTWLLDHHELHLMLQANPDGRKKAETGLLWRKNTNENYCSPTSNSRGADLNRNYEFQWGCCGGSSGSECSETYRGPTPASEPETQAVQGYVRSQFPDQREDPLTSPAPITATGVFLDIHSYSELVLWPWGFTNNATPNGTALQTLGRKFAYFNDYYPEQSIGLYPTDGTTTDFGYGDLGLASYTFELGTSFFQSCGVFENTILPDNMPALIYAAKVARTPYLTPAGPETLAPALANNGVVASGDAITLTATLDDTRFNNQNGTEPTQDVVAAEYYVDTPPWITATTPISVPMAAADGSFNSSVEDGMAVVDTTGLDAGRHTIFVRGQDAAGNWGPFSAAFLYVIDPAVAPTLEGFVRDAATNMPIAATISVGNQFQAETNPATGHYQLQVISGTYDVTAAAPDYGAQTVTGLALQDTQTVQQDFALYPTCTVFAEDVESGANGWTAQTPWAITSEDAHSPTHSWTDSPGGSYGNNRDVAITSPVLDMSGVSALTLNFWQICDTEAGWDYCHVEISPDGGNTWSEIATYDGNSTQWEEISLDASLLDNEAAARIRFRFTSDGSVTDDGWHVDDIRLIGAGPSCLTALEPTAGFTSNSPVALGETAVFTNTSSGSDLSFAWDFGDGSPVVTDTNPTHLYTAPMTYTVTLTASNDLGSDVFTDTVAVVDVGVAPTAGFVSNSPVFVGETVVFTNTSSGSDLSFGWDFGDGASSTAISPTHVYTASGVYTVTLTASNGLGTDTVEAPVQVFLMELHLPAVMKP